MAFLIAGCDSSKAEIISLEEYYATIDYNCQSDADCEIKDIHNCCGYYPACANKDAIVSLETVEQICSESMMAGICGFPSIKSCICKNNKCANVQPEYQKSEHEYKLQE